MDERATEQRVEMVIWMVACKNTCAGVKLLGDIGREGDVGYERLTVSTISCLLWPDFQHVIQFTRNLLVRPLSHRQIVEIIRDIAATEFERQVLHNIQYPELEKRASSMGTSDARVPKILFIAADRIGNCGPRESGKLAQATHGGRHSGPDGGRSQGRPEGQGVPKTKHY